jgi:23S rRNA (guanine2445-N2)-methyltransferase / 23S rRNA (guanine2069-N7)-methyltransferase
VYHQAHEKSVLNLFCYTAAVGVQAALGGASTVMNVDLSATYLKWAHENFLLNQLDDETRYQFLRADIVELLKNPDSFSIPRNFDLIFLDPPSFSNSSKMQQTLDIQRDHEDLIKQAMKLLAPDGLLLFSTNRRGFKLADEIQQSCEARDISHATLPEDFKRNPKIHRCWELRYKD